jgi:hypothetical protein
LMAAGGPLIFFAVALIEGFLRPGYDLLASPISALALGPRGWIQTANFVLLAASFLCFAAVLRWVLRGGIAAVAGPVVLAIMAVGVLGAAAFPLDPPGVPPTTLGMLHRIMAVLLVFLLMPIACFIAAWRFRGDRRSRREFGYTLATGLFCAGMFAMVMLFVSPPGQPPREANAYFGLLQRLDVLAFFAWMAVVSLRAARGPARHGLPSGAPEPFATS